MPEYLISYGLGGSFGGASNFQVEKCPDLNSANELAFELAKEDYQNYEGRNGLPSWSEIEDEFEEMGEDYSDEDIDIAYEEAVESWIVYSAELYDEEKHLDLL